MAFFAFAHLIVFCRSFCAFSCWTCADEHCGLVWSGAPRCLPALPGHWAKPGAGTGFEGSDCLGGMVVQIKWSQSTKIEHCLWLVTQTWNLSTTLVHGQVISCNIQFLNIPYFWCPTTIVWLDHIPFPVHFLVATDYSPTMLGLPTIYRVGWTDNLHSKTDILHSPTGIAADFIGGWDTHSTPLYWPRSTPSQESGEDLNRRTIYHPFLTGELGYARLCSQLISFLIRQTMWWIRESATTKLHSYLTTYFFPNRLVSVWISNRFWDCQPSLSSSPNVSRQY